VAVCVPAYRLPITADHLFFCVGGQVQNHFNTVVEIAGSSRLCKLIINFEISIFTKRIFHNIPKDAHFFYKKEFP
jgi:hypothetical protein